MKITLLEGDFVIGIKSAYNIKTPNFIPLTKIQIPSINLIHLNKPKRNDIIVFRLNELLSNSNYSNLDLIKRIVGLPGEIIHIHDKKIFVNGIETENFFTIEDNSNSNKEFEIYKFSQDDFSYLNYGPIKIPAKGDTIILNPKNIKFWQPLINFENNGKFISNEGTVITFKGRPIKQYIIKENYYFVLGDNLLNSVDSRILGFIPECEIVAKVKMIYLSLEPKANYSTSNFFERIRFNRMLKYF